MIAYFVYNLSTYSGAAKQAMLLASNLDKKVVIFNFDKSINEPFTKFLNIDCINISGNYFVKTIILLYSTFKYKIKIYHLHGFFLSGLILGVVFQRKIILKTTLLNDDDFLTLKTKLTWPIISFLLSKIKLNIVLTDYMKAINRSINKVIKIIKIPNGVYFPINPPDIDDKLNSFCFVGLISERKKTLESIKYFIDHYRNEIESKMYVVGPLDLYKTINEFQTEYINCCRQLVKDSNLEDRIIFTGNLPEQEVRNILRICKALIFFSEKEGMPNVVLEAISENCIPIVSNMDGVAKEILGSNFEFLINNNHSKVEISKLDELISSKLLYNQALNRYSINVIASQYSAIYESL